MAHSGGTKPRWCSVHCDVYFKLLPMIVRTLHFSVRLGSIVLFRALKRDPATRIRHAFRIIPRASVKAKTLCDLPAFSRFKGTLQKPNLNTTILSHISGSDRYQILFPSDFFQKLLFERSEKMSTPNPPAERIPQGGGTSCLSLARDFMAHLLEWLDLEGGEFFGLAVQSIIPFHTAEKRWWKTRRTSPKSSTSEALEHSAYGCSKS